VLTLDDNLILPSNIPAVGQTWASWELGQKDRTIDPEWNGYVFVDAIEAAPGRRSFVFGKLKTGAAVDVPFETYFDSEFHRWPAVVIQTLRVIAFNATGNSVSANGVTDRYFIKSATEGNCTIKVEHFQNAVPFDQSKMRHPIPVTDDLNLGTLVISDCLHGEIRRFERTDSSGNAEVKLDSATTGLGYTIPATNFVDWAPYILKDSQKQSNGMWVREKVTIFPPINAKRRII